MVPPSPGTYLCVGCSIKEPAVNAIRIRYAAFACPTARLAAGLTELCSAGRHAMIYVQLRSEDGALA